MDAEDVIHQLIPLPPKGNPGWIRNQCAPKWADAARLLNEIRTTLDNDVRNAQASWDGDAYQKFAGDWKAVSANIETATGEINTFASQLRSGADAIESAKRKYKVAITAAGVTAVVGIAATVISFGAAAPATGATVAAEVAVVEAEMAATTLTLNIALNAIARAALQFGTRFALGTGVNLGAQGVASAFVYPDHNPFAHLDFKMAAETGVGAGVGGPIAGGVSKLTGATGATSLFVRTTSSAAGAAATDAVVQEVVYHDVDPARVIAAGITGGAVESLSGLRNAYKPRTGGDSGSTTPQVRSAPKHEPPDDGSLKPDDDGPDGSPKPPAHEMPPLPVDEQPAGAAANQPPIDYRAVRAEADAAVVAARGEIEKFDRTTMIAREAPAAQRLIQEQTASGPDAHFYDRHGAHLTLQQLYIRAKTRLLPDEPKKGASADASRFISNEAQLEAFDAVTAAYKAVEGTPQAYSAWEPVEVVMPEIVGDGFKKTSLAYARGNTVVGKFDGNGNLMTLFVDLP